MSDLMAQRYGGNSPVRRWLTIGVAALLALAGLAWLAWAAWFHSTPDADAAVSAYDVKSSHRVDARIQLRLDGEDVTGSCLLRASAADHSIVGELNLSVRELAEAEGTWIPIRTERRATSVTVVSCKTR